MKCLNICRPRKADVYSNENTYSFALIDNEMDILFSQEILVEDQLFHDNLREISSDEFKAQSAINKSPFISAKKAAPANIFTYLEADNIGLEESQKIVDICSKYPDILVGWQVEIRLRNSTKGDICVVKGIRNVLPFLSPKFLLIGSLGLKSEIDSSSYFEVWMNLQGHGRNKNLLRVLRRVTVQQESIRSNIIDFKGVVDAANSSPTIAKPNPHYSKIYTRDVTVNNSQPRKSKEDNVIHELEQKILTLEDLLRESIAKNDELSAKLQLQERMISNLHLRDGCDSSIEGADLYPVVVPTSTSGGVLVGIDPIDGMQNDLHCANSVGVDDAIQPSSDGSGSSSNGDGSGDSRSRSDVSFSSQCTGKTEGDGEGDDDDLNTRGNSRLLPTTSSVDRREVDKGATNGSVYADIVNSQYDFKKPLVFDNGSAFSKVGFADDDAPIAIFSTTVGRPKHSRFLLGPCKKEYYVGDDSQELKNVLTLKYPITQGVISNWEDMEIVWHHTFHNVLNVLPEEHPVLLTDKPGNPKYNRERMAQIMFETFDVPAMYVSMQAVLSLYATGRSTGCVFDCGDGASHIVPIYEGFIPHHAISRFAISGSDLTDFLSSVLNMGSNNHGAAYKRETVVEVKEKLSIIVSPGSFESSTSEGARQAYELPDGKVVYLGNERYRCPEALFQPSILNKNDHPGIHESIFQTIVKCDVDVRRDLYANIVLSGGGAMFPGMAERLSRELQYLAPSTVKVKVTASPPEQKCLAWIGGAVLASLSAFQQLWISKMEYEEVGPAIVHHRCSS